MQIQEAIKAQRKIAVISMMKDFTDKVDQMYQALRGRKKLKLYTGTSDAAQIKCNMQGIDAAWENEDVVIHNSKINASISYENAKLKFHTLFMYGITSGSGTCFDLVQMLGCNWEVESGNIIGFVESTCRPRKPIVSDIVDREMYMFDHQVKSTRKQLAFDVVGAAESHEPSRNLFHCLQHTLMHNWSKNYFMPLLKILLAKNGISIH